MSGKGSAPRPFEVTQEVFASNWDVIFKKGNKDVLQQKANRPIGTPEADSQPQGRSDSSGDCQVPSDNQPTL